MQCDNDGMFSPGGNPADWNHDEWDDTASHGIVHCLDGQWHTVTGTNLIKLNAVYLEDSTSPVLADEVSREKGANLDIAAADEERD